MKNYLTATILPTALTVSAMVCGSAAQSPTVVKSNAKSAAVPQGTAVVVELAKSLNARKARSGDAVKAKVIQDVISSGQIVIHRGSTLIGHVTEAKGFSQDEPRSVLGVVFDRVALKGGEEMACNAVLQALAPPVQEPDPLASSTYDGSLARGSQPVSRSRGTDWTVDPRDRIDHQKQDALDAAADPSHYGTGTNTLHHGLLGSGNHGVFGMPGVSLKADAGVPAPELVSTKADIKLETGTQMVLEVTRQ
ncbi:MAG TPA: hypothetical protein VKY85_22570 [Candidatus Angelobacter sp.]|nr:hypothetical protein [Candidatus Angelobacter sp.]